MINHSFLTPDGRIINISANCPSESLTYLVKIQLCILKLRYAPWINVFWVVNSLIPYPCGSTVKLPISPRPVPWSRLRNCEVSTLYLENCANARRIYVFERLTFILDPSGGTVESSTSHDLYLEYLTYLWSFNSVAWKLGECMLSLRVFE